MVGEPDRRWMAWLELAAALGVSVEAAMTRAHRAGWHKRRNNEGVAGVEVPLSALAARPGPEAATAARVAQVEARRDAARAELGRVAAKLVKQNKRWIAAEAELVGFKARLQVGELWVLLETAGAQAAQSFWTRMVALLPKPRR